MTGGGGWSLAAMMMMERGEDDDDDENEISNRHRGASGKRVTFLSEGPAARVASPLFFRVGTDSFGQ